jgi:hypothetical protein
VGKKFNDASLFPFKKKIREHRNASKSSRIVIENLYQGQQFIINVIEATVVNVIKINAREKEPLSVNKFFGSKTKHLMEPELTNFTERKKILRTFKFRGS